MAHILGLIRSLNRTHSRIATSDVSSSLFLPQFEFASNILWEFNPDSLQDSTDVRELCPREAVGSGLVRLVSDWLSRLKVFRRDVVCCL